MHIQHIINLQVHQHTLSEHCNPHATNNVQTPFNNPQELSRKLVNMIVVSTEQKQTHNRGTAKAFLAPKNS